jgi:hypothetical protein
MIWLKANWRLVLGVAVLVGLFGAGWVSRGWYEAAADLRVTQAIDKAVAKASDLTGKQIAGITVANTTIMGKVVERVVTEKVYTECRHDPATFEYVKEALKND